MRQPSDTQKLWFGYIVGAAIFTACLGVSAQGGRAALLHLLLCLLGVAAGWTVGIVATPLDESEETKFSALTKGFLALGSGYAIAKLENPIVSAATDTMKSDTAMTSLVGVALFSTCLLVGLLFTLVTRLYSESEGERKAKRRSALLKRAEEISKDLRKTMEA
jgi:hypothetical protein